MTMRLFQTVLAIIIITYYHNCSEYKNVANQTLYDKIVDNFFPKELLNPKINMNFYLCHSTLPHETCCQCTKTCKYYGTCCIDAFVDNNITSVEEYLTLFLKMTNMRRYVTNLPVTSIRIFHHISTLTKSQQLLLVKINTHHMPVFAMEVIWVMLEW